MPHLRLPDGASLYYESHGPKPGAAPALVFAHGAGGNHLSWWQQVPHFRDRYTCIVFDHRGWGISSKPADGKPIPGGQFAGDLRALLDHLGIERASIIAQSMGGWTSLRFALESPQRVERLVLCDTHGGISSPDIDGWVQATAENVAKLPPGVHPAVGERMYAEQPELAFLYEDIDALNRNTRPEIFAAIQRAGTVSLDEAASIKFPVLELYGEEDIVIPPPFLDAAAAAIPGARIVRIPKAGHSPYFERPTEFNAAVEEFLSA